MARPDSRRKTTRQNVSTIERDTVAFQPATPLVSAAPSGGADAAFALADALATANQYVGVKRQIGLQTGAAMAQAGQIEQGEYDELNAAEIEGAERVFLRNSVRADLQDIENEYLEMADKGMAPEDMQEWVRQRYAERFEGLEEREYNQVADMIGKGETLLLDAHQRRTQQEITDRMTVEAAANFDADVSANPEAYAAWREATVGVLGVSATNDIAANRLAEAIARSPDPEAFAALDAWEPLVTNPKYREALGKAVRDREKVLTAEEQEAEYLTRIATLAELQSQADAGNLDEQAAYNAVVPDFEGGRAALITDSEYLALLRKNRSGSVTVALEPIHWNHMLQGIGGYLSDSEANAAFAIGLQQAAPEEQDMLAITIGTNNGLMYDRHKNQMNNASPRNPEVFMRGFQLYEAYEGTVDGFAAEHIDADSVRDYELYKMHRQMLGDDRQALESITTGQLNFKLVDEVNRADFNDILDDTVDDLLDNPGLLTGGIENTTQLRADVRRRMEYGIATGLSPERAAEVAFNTVRQTLNPVDNFLFPANGGFNQEIADWYRETMLPEGEDPDDWMFYPGPDPKTVIIRHVNDPGVFGSGPGPLSVNDLALQHAQWQVQERMRSAREGQAAARRDAERAVRNEYFGARWYENAFDPRIREMIEADRSAQWDELSQRDKDNLIDQHIAEEAARRERVRQRVVNMELNAL